MPYWLICTVRDCLFNVCIFLNVLRDVFYDTGTLWSHNKVVPEKMAFTSFFNFMRFSRRQFSRNSADNSRNDILF